MKSIATPKIANRGKVCIFVGYAKMHAGDCYRMFDPDTNRVHTTRDVRWLQKYYFDENENGLSNERTSDASKARKGIMIDDDDECTLEHHEPTTSNVNNADDSSAVTNNDDSSNESSNATDNVSSSDNESSSDNNESTRWTRVTASGRRTKTPALFNPETGAFTAAEINYYQLLEDMNEFE